VRTRGRRTANVVPPGDAAAPFRVIVSDSPCRTLAEGQVRHYPTMLQAAKAFAKAAEPFKQIVFDDGHEARWLTRSEQWMLESVCGFHGLDVEERDYGEGTT
jgi:hypothetical protein